METWEVVILCLLALFIGIAILMLTDVKEKIRRKKHPVWYEYYDRALSNSVVIGSRFREQTETINARRELIQDMFFQGRCAVDKYDDAMKAFDKEQREAAKRFSRDKEGILQDLAAADAYAKDHNLKWGIIYK